MKSNSECPVLVLDNVEHQYGTKTALEAVSLNVQQGQILGLLGPNGAGKTTLLSIAATVLRPTRGDVCIGGTIVRTMADARKVRRYIGFLPQKAAWFPDFTVLSYVRYVAWLRGVDSVSELGLARDAIARVGLTQVEHDRMSSLSGGMVQRACLAAALVGDIKVLILDEPTVGLDPELRIEFREVIRNLDSVAVVLSTHLMEDVAALASSIAILDHGALKFFGTTAELAAGHEPRGDRSALDIAYLAAIHAGSRAR